MHFFVI